MVNRPKVSYPLSLQLKVESGMGKYEIGSDQVDKARP